MPIACAFQGCYALTSLVEQPIEGFNPDPERALQSAAPRGGCALVNVSSPSKDDQPFKLRVDVNEIVAGSLTRSCRIVEVARKPIPPITYLAQRMVEGGGWVSVFVKHLYLWPLKLDGIPDETIGSLLRDQEVRLVLGAEALLWYNPCAPPLRKVLYQDARVLLEETLHVAFVAGSFKCSLVRRDLIARQLIPRDG